MVVGVVGVGERTGRLTRWSGRLGRWEQRSAAAARGNFLREASDPAARAALVALTETRNEKELCIIQRRRAT